MKKKNGNGKLIGWAVALIVLVTGAASFLTWGIQNGALPELQRRKDKPSQETWLAPSRTTTMSTGHQMMTGTGQKGYLGSDSHPTAEGSYYGMALSNQRFLGRNGIWV